MTVRRKPILASVGLCLAMLSSCNPFDPSLTYRADGWCLRHSGEGNMTLFPHPTRPRGVPDFLVPADFALAQAGERKGERWLIATCYLEEHRGRIGCRRVSQENGLDLLVGERLSNCRANKRVYNKYVPTSPTNETRTVYVRCSKNAANCRLAYMLDEEWSASVALPVTDLDRWDEAVRVTRDYYHEYITDCGI